MLHTSVAGCQDSLIRAVEVASADLDGDDAGFDEHTETRIRLAASCRDCGALPKVQDAGGFRDVGDAPVPVMRDGILVARDACCGPWMTEIIRRLHGHHEPQEELPFSHVLEVIAGSEDAPTMIELGSWWGYYSLWFRRQNPSRSVVALEPDLPYLEAGKRNFALNGANGLSVHGAIGDAPGTNLEFSSTSDGRTRGVRQYALLELMDFAGVERVALLLADIQCAESALIEQSRELLAARLVRFLVVSTHHWTVSGDELTHQRVLGTNREVRGHLIAEHTIGKSYSGDRLIVASFDPRDAGFVVELSRARQAESLFVELEYDLATAHRRTRELEDELQQQRSAREAVEARLKAMRQRRIWRYSAIPRRLCDRVSAMRNLE